MTGSGRYAIVGAGLSSSFHFRGHNTSIGIYCWGLHPVMGYGEHGKARSPLHYASKGGGRW